MSRGKRLQRTHFFPRALIVDDNLTSTPFCGVELDVTCKHDGNNNRKHVFKEPVGRNSFTFWNINFFARKFDRKNHNALIYVYIYNIETNNIYIYLCILSKYEKQVSTYNSDEIGGTWGDKL